MLRSPGGNEGVREGTAAAVPEQEGNEQHESGAQVGAGRRGRRCCRARAPGAAGSHLATREIKKERESGTEEGATTAFVAVR